ncbi:MAG: hypothetical protein ABI852_11460, partial [Gemmatimonadaceae bacterium]
LVALEAEPMASASTVLPKNRDVFNISNQRSNPMQMKKRTTFALASTLGLVLALAASSGMASAMSSYDGGGDDDGEAGLKNQACAAIGCANGNRLCATASGTVKAGIPPWVGEVTVVYTCYESPFF